MSLKRQIELIQLFIF